MLPASKTALTLDASLKPSPFASLGNEPAQAAPRFPLSPHASRSPWTSLPDPSDSRQRRRAEQWSGIVRDQLETYLAYSGEEESTVQSLRDFCQDKLFDAHTFGPAADPEKFDLQPTAPWKSFVADDASPAEFSLAISDSYVKTRLVFEPTPLYRQQMDGHVELDTVNALAPLRWARRNRSLNRYTNFDWLERLAAQLVLPASEASKYPVAQQLTQVAYGVEMIKELPVLKAYFGIDAIARAKKISKEVLLQRSLASLGFSQGWNTIHAYLDAVNARRPRDEPLATAEFIGFDCVEPNKSRMKVYVRFRSIANADDLVSHLNMNGKSDRVSLAEQSRWAVTLWDHLCAPQTSNVTCSELQDQDERVRGALVYYELTMDNQTPRAKFYLPVRHFFRTDFELARRLDDFLHQHHLRPKGWYQELCKKLATHRSLDSRSGLQTIVGCAHKKGRLELTVYFSTEMYAPERWASAPF